MIMKKTTQKNDTLIDENKVVLSVRGATTALYFLKRVVVQGHEQTELFNVYEELMQSIAQHDSH